jgi:hypothetical protein
MFDALRSRLALLRGHVGGLVRRTPPARSWAVPENENIAKMLQVVDELNAALAAERVVVRFDLSTGVAKYFPAIDTIRLRPIRSEEGLNEAAVNMVHEYTHYRQDVVLEQELLGQRVPKEQTAEEQLAAEIEGRRNHVYFRSLIEIMGYRCDVADLISTGVFLDRFERERLAGTPEEKAAVSAEIRDAMIKGGYVEEPSRVYMVELRPDRRAVMVGVAGAETDLGIVPAAYRDRIQLSGYLKQQVNALPTRPDLFRGEGGTQYPLIQFVVFEAGLEVAGFDVEP